MDGLQRVARELAGDYDTLWTTWLGLGAALGMYGGVCAAVKTDQTSSDE